MNSFFLDGSALAKRYVAEPGTPLMNYLLDHVAAPDGIAWSWAASGSMRISTPRPR